MQDMGVTTNIRNVFYHLGDAANHYVSVRTVFVVVIILQLVVLIFNIQYNQLTREVNVTRTKSDDVRLYTLHSLNQKDIKDNVLAGGNHMNASSEFNGRTAAPKCPLVSPYLQGTSMVNYHVYDEIAIKVLNPLVQKGGRYRPTSCKARHKVAIIIPYRNRKTHLRILLNNLHPFLQRQQLDYGIFVIELAPMVEFNRALSLNIGFNEALKHYDYDCFIFHDVDLIPENDHNTYSCPENPRHMSVAVSKFKYQLPYMTLFGGVTAMTREQYETVNGYSNIFFKWGGEDDDMYRRIRANNMTISRYTPDVATYVMLSHEQDEKNPERERLLESGIKRWENDGLSSFKYTVLQTIEKHLYTYILASINPDDKVYSPVTDMERAKPEEGILDPVLSKTLLKMASAMLNTIGFSSGFIVQLQKGFLKLNTTNVTMENVARVIRDMDFAIPKFLPSVDPGIKVNEKTPRRFSKQIKLHDVPEFRQFYGHVDHPSGSESERRFRRVLKPNHRSRRDNEDLYQQKAKYDTTALKEKFIEEMNKHLHAFRNFQERDAPNQWRFEQGKLVRNKNNMTRSIRLSPKVAGVVLNKTVHDFDKTVYLPTHREQETVNIPYMEPLYDKTSKGPQRESNSQDVLPGNWNIHWREQNEDQQVKTTI